MRKSVFELKRLHPVFSSVEFHDAQGAQLKLEKNQRLGLNFFIFLKARLEALRP